MCVFPCVCVRVVRACVFPVYMLCSYTLGILHFLCNL